MPDQSELSTRAAPEGPAVIEGGAVERVTDLPFEERRHRAKTARTLAYLLVDILAATIGLRYGEQIANTPMVPCVVRLRVMSPEASIQ
jgi:hypothetical protein